MAEAATQNTTGVVVTNGVASPDYSTSRRISYTEFLEWLDEDTHAEWVDGELVPMSPISLVHTKQGKFLLSLISIFVQHYRLGEVAYEPFQMKTGPGLPGRSPDILFVANEHLDRLQQTYLDGPADLVVEIVSPDDPDRDYVTKFREYQTGGVREYWIVDPQRRQAYFHQLDANGQYQLAALDDQGCYHSTVLPGLWLREAWLWQEPLPGILDVLREWKLI